MIKSCYSIIVKLSDQPWWILISHEHGRKQICALLIMKTINNKLRPVSLYRKCLKYLWQKKKLTRVHSSHLGHECIIWGHFMKKGAFYLLLLFMFISNWFFFSKLQAVYWVVSPRCIKYATTFFELLLYTFTLVKLLFFFILKFFVRVNIFKCRRLFSSLFSFCS